MWSREGPIPLEDGTAGHPLSIGVSPSTSMHISGSHKIQSRAGSDAEPAILNRLEEYRIQLDASRKIPEMIVPVLLEKGRMLLQSDPQKFEATVRALMDSATHMHPFDAKRFLREKVTSETFEFQARFDSLRAPSDVSLSGMCGIHINSVPLFANLRDSEMAPLCKRFRRGWDREDPDSYRVCFASGEVGPLSQFLAGHALLRRPLDPAKPKWLGEEKNPWTVNLAEWWALEPTQQRFAEKFAIAVVVGTELGNPEDYLDILSPVRNSREIVDFIGITEPTKVRVERLPHTVLLPEQVSELRRESDLHLAGAVAQDRRTDRATFPGQYVVTAHAELVMKFRLLKVHEWLVSQRTAL
jgi:hypothetical protein